MARPAAVIDVTAAHTGLLVHFRWLAASPEAYAPRVAVVRNGAAVSVCYCSRKTACAAEAGVETLAAYRGRGYAAAVTAAWAHEVQRGGLVPLYSTSWDNLASRAVAQRLGLIQYGVDLHWT